MVKTQIELARGLAQAAAYGPGTGKDAAGDVYMNSLGAQAESLQVAIQALMGKGKGGFRKGLGKGSPKGAASPGKGGAEGSAEFNGVCHHCGIWGHRRSDCRRLDTEMAKKGGGKSDKGGGTGLESL